MRAMRVADAALAEPAAVVYDVEVDAEAAAFVAATRSVEMNAAEVAAAGLVILDAEAEAEAEAEAGADAGGDAGAAVGAAVGGGGGEADTEAEGAPADLAEAVALFVGDGAAAPRFARAESSASESEAPRSGSESTSSDEEDSGDDDSDDDNEDDTVDSADL